MNETPPPYDPTALLPAASPESTGPAGRPRWRARLGRVATPMFAGAVALLLAGALGGYLLGSRGAGAASTGAVSLAASGSSDPYGGFDPGDPYGPGGAGPGGPCGRGGFGPGGPHGPGGFGRGGGAVGTIDSVNGTTITLTTRNGRKITVTAADSVAVTLRSPGSVSDLKPGQRVFVSGQRDADGNITANRIDVGAPK